MSPSKECYEERLAKDQIPAAKHEDVVAKKAKGSDLSKASFWSNPIVSKLILIVILAAFFASSMAMLRDTEKPQSHDGLDDVHRDLAAIKAFFVSREVSDSDLLEDSNSPQFRACEYLARSGLAIPSEGQEDYVYRYIAVYAMALFYFATSPDLEWPMNDTSDVCLWHNLIPYPDVSQEFSDLALKQVEGVFCEENGTATHLFMPSSALTGQLPTELALITPLRFLDLNNNELTGTIPKSFSTMTNMKNFFAASNKLTGTIPTWTYSKIQNINLSNNTLTGTVQWEDWGMKDLEGIALDHNYIEGGVSGLSAKNFPKLQQVYLSHNHFSGTLREETLDMDSLKFLGLSHNHFYGSIPHHLFALPNLKVLNLNTNGFTGLLPPISSNSSLQMLTLHQCPLGPQPIPNDVSNLRSLEHLDLSQGGFTGTGPSSLAKLTLLEQLFIAENDFDENFLEEWLPKLTNLIEVSIKSTHATGSIPDLSGLTNLVLLDLDDNSLGGQIPTILGTLTDLRFLLLNRNPGIKDEVPSSIMALPNLDLLFLEHAVLTDYMCNESAVVQKGAMIFGQCSFCHCCTTCCEESEKCNENLHVPNYDPIWQATFQRQQFVFGPTAHFLPTPSGKKPRWTNRQSH